MRALYTIHVRTLLYKNLTSTTSCIVNTPYRSTLVYPVPYFIRIFRIVAPLMLFVDPKFTSVALPLVVRRRITCPKNLRTRALVRAYVTTRACVQCACVKGAEGRWVLEHFFLEISALGLVYPLLPCQYPWIACFYLFLPLN